MIDALVTAVWPVTDATLVADTSSLDYAAAKVAAIARAKLALYRTRAIPTLEADIPEVARYWIADQAVVFLIPAATDYYMVKQRLSDSKENANFTYYDKVQALLALKAELERACREGLEDALAAIATGSESVQKNYPAVSTRALLVDPLQRARRRGPR
jgi:hypothetical protein